jgi:hypothetical protein
MRISGGPWLHFVTYLVKGCTFDMGVNKIASLKLLYNIKIIINYLFLDFLTLEDGTDRLSRNVGKGLPPDAV